MRSFSSQKGVRSFFVIWAGQLISLTGTVMTGFALAVWTYQKTGSVTQYSFIALATAVPGILLSPFAGALVDRWDRRRVMILAVTGSAAAVGGIALLLLAGHLEIWYLVLLLSIASSCESFQSPAFSASVTLLVPKERLGNYNGIVQLGQAVPKVLSPAIAGLLVAWIHIWGVIAIDFVTFLVAVVSLLVVRIPSPPPSAVVQAGRETGKPSFKQEILEGFRYLKERPGLLSVLVIFAVTYYSIGVVNVAGPALVLSFTSPQQLGIALSLVSIGFIGGSVLMSVWGGPRRRINGVLGFTIPFGLGILMAG
jgi:MFS family permease